MLVKLAKQYTADEPAEPWEQFYAQRIASHSAVLTNRSPWPHAGAAYESARVRWTAGEPGSLVGGTQQKSVMSRSREPMR